ncbi:hypothetical protein C2845_PM07G29720 [Panicum miliaceum]|uniref:RNase H type-1 domain-containing protein n=1 Tax=Panicum miliaceum TaxID=4540 RepID=A0A3L6SSN3_PANMI|nr:hypothetical protein C2845_PM07G29720 [Panicum miliaceum]
MGKLMLILWRCWFVHNELTQSARKLSIEASVGFLLNYWDTMITIRQDPILDRKGKQVCGSSSKRSSAKESMKPCWQMPEAGVIKINVDGAFKENGDASIGVVIRDSAGSVLLTAWRVISNAASAEEVELLACREGVSLAAEWSPLPAILESDCLSAVNVLRKPSDQRSSSTFVIQETTEVAKGLPSFQVHHIKREQNGVAHELLAQLAIRLFHNAVWRNRCPACVEQLVTQDCNLVSE